MRSISQPSQVVNDKMALKVEVAKVDHGARRHLINLKEHEASSKDSAQIYDAGARSKESSIESNVGGQFSKVLQRDAEVGEGVRDNDSLSAQPRESITAATDTVQQSTETNHDNRPNNNNFANEHEKLNDKVGGQSGASKEADTSGPAQSQHRKSISIAEAIITNDSGGNGLAAVQDRPEWMEGDTKTNDGGGGSFLSTHSNGSPSAPLFIVDEQKANNLDSLKNIANAKRHTTMGPKADGTSVFSAGNAGNNVNNTTERTTQGATARVVNEVEKSGKTQLIVADIRNNQTGADNERRRAVPPIKQQHSTDGLRSGEEYNNSANKSVHGENNRGGRATNNYADNGARRSFPEPQSQYYFASNDGDQAPTSSSSSLSPQQSVYHTSIVATRTTETPPELTMTKGVGEAHDDIFTVVTTSAPFEEHEGVATGVHKKQQSTENNNNGPENDQSMDYVVQSQSHSSFPPAEATLLPVTINESRKKTHVGIEHEGGKDSEAFDNGGHKNPEAHGSEEADVTDTKMDNFRLHEPSSSSLAPHLRQATNWKDDEGQVKRSPSELLARRLGTEAADQILVNHSFRTGPSINGHDNKHEGPVAVDHTNRLQIPSGRSGGGGDISNTNTNIPNPVNPGGNMQRSDSLVSTMNNSYETILATTGDWSAVNSSRMDESDRSAVIVKTLEDEQFATKSPSMRMDAEPNLISESFSLQGSSPPPQITISKTSDYSLVSEKSMRIRDGPVTETPAVSIPEEEQSTTTAVMMVAVATAEMGAPLSYLRVEQISATETTSTTLSDPTTKERGLATTPTLTEGSGGGDRAASDSVAVVKVQIDDSGASLKYENFSLPPRVEAQEKILAASLATTASSSSGDPPRDDSREVMTAVTVSAPEENRLTLQMGESDNDSVSEVEATVTSIMSGGRVSASIEEDGRAAVVNEDGSVWPVKHAAIVEGDVVIGGLMMVHEREDSVVCGPIMPQGGVQALEAMLYTLDKINSARLLPNITLGAHILDDCDKDTYGLEMAVDFIKGELGMGRT